MNAAEETFVRTFVARDLRDRWLTRLAAERTRAKLLGKLAHDLLPDLDSRFVYDKESPPPEIAAQVRRELEAWRKGNPDQLCHVIANSERDGRLISLGEAERDYQLTFGAIIIVVPDRLAYYHTERSNLSRQPFYVLFHP